MAQEIEKYTIREEDIEDEIMRIKESELDHEKAINYANSFSVSYGSEEVKRKFIQKINELYESK